MRLIDADMLKDVPMFNGQYDRKNANENFILGIETVIDFINELPTVQRTKGHWMSGKDFANEHYCSECRYRVITEKLDWQYCPRCGADMR